VQNLTRERWTEEKVNEKQETMMVKAFNEVYSDYFNPNELPAGTTVEPGSRAGDVAVEMDVGAYESEMQRTRREAWRELPS